MNSKERKTPDEIFEEFGKSAFIIGCLYMAFVIVSMIGIALFSIYGG